MQLFVSLDDKERLFYLTILCPFIFQSNKNYLRNLINIFNIYAQIKLCGGTSDE